MMNPNPIPTNSAELLLKNQQTLREIGEATASGPTYAAIQLAVRLTQEAEALLGCIGEERRIAVESELERERARNAHQIEA